MTNLYAWRPLDNAIAASLNDVTEYVSGELAARLRARRLAAQIGYSGQSCSAYVEVEVGEDDAYCVRVSDHEARSYNRAGDFTISLGDIDSHTNALVRLTAVYEIAEFTPELDADGEETGYGTMTYRLTDNPDEDDAEFAGWRVDAEDIEAAIEQAEAAVLRHA